MKAAMNCRMMTAECECLITSNIKDFSELENPLIDIVLPKEFCN